MLGVMRALGIALVLVAALTAPAIAQPPDEEIEMEPEEAAPPPDTKAPADRPPTPADPPTTDAPADAAAEPPPVPKDPRLARKEYNAGRRFVQKGDYLTRANKPDDAKAQYEQALAAFEKAVAASDTLDYQFDLAGVHEKLGKLDVAAKHYLVLVKAQTGVRADIKKKATAKFDELSVQIGLLTLRTKPEGATISLGGNELGTTPLAEPLILMPGSYTFALAADGFQPKEIEIKVEEGSESERTIELEPIPIVVEPVKPRDDEEVVTAPIASQPSKLPIYVGGGAAIALAGVATVTGIMATSAHNKFTAADSSPSEREDAKARGENLAVVADVALVGAVAAAGFTAYWYFCKYKSGQRKASAERSAAATSKVDVVPWVKHDAGGPVGGFGITGSF